MASGVKVAEEVKIKYDDIKKKKSYRYLVFFIKDEKVIAVEKIGDRDRSYNDFLADITGSGPDDCRYGVFDFEYTHQCQGTSEASKKEKSYRYLVFYIKDEKVIQVEKVGDRNADYQEFLQDLYVGGPDDCRYGVFDFEYTHQCQGTTEAS